MKTPNAHFWFSQKQKDHLQLDTVAIIGGREVEFTAQIVALSEPFPSHGLGWDDLRYLGYGYAYSYDGVVQE